MQAVSSSTIAEASHALGSWRYWPRATWQHGLKRIISSARWIAWREFTKKVRERSFITIKYCFDDGFPLHSNAGIWAEDAMIIKDIGHCHSPNLHPRWNFDHLPKYINHNRISIQRPVIGLRGFDIYRQEWSLPGLRFDAWAHYVIHDVATSTRYLVVIHQKPAQLWNNCWCYKCGDLIDSLSQQDLAVNK